MVIVNRHSFLSTGSQLLVTCLFDSAISPHIQSIISTHFGKYTRKFAYAINKCKPNLRKGRIWAELHCHSKHIFPMKQC